MVLDERQGGSAAEAGRQLAAAAAATVVWPTAAVKWPAEVGEVIPKTLPPLRSDRDTVLIGTLKGKEPLRIEASVDGPGGVKKLSWTAAPGKSMEDNNYLPALVDAGADRRRLGHAPGGLGEPGGGAAADPSGRPDDGQLAQQAIASGNLDGAERLAEEALRRDPGDPEALAVKGAVAKARQRRRGEEGRRLPTAASQRAGGRRRRPEPGRRRRRRGPAAGGGRKGPMRKRSAWPRRP